MDKVFNVLFLSQRNSARSVLAAALLNTLGRGQFRAYSAGVRPAPSVDPIAMDLLAHVGVAPGGVRPKSCDEFIDNGAPALDFVFTLSDTAAGEAPPLWPGHPVTGHWRCEDPEKFAPDDPERRLSLIRTRAGLERRLRVFMNLPFAALDRMSLQQHVDGIGREE
ncbi:MAG TPA: arsenate reductase ArsC [Steroidobacteraceae bacterium]|nr:arsenate reductase ArsC [Steroidobacteraceae bacterium]